MKIDIVKAGKTDKKEIGSLVQLYQKRIVSYIPTMQILDVKESKANKKVDRHREEEKYFSQALDKNSLLIALTDKGKAMSSTAFAKWLSGHINVSQNLSFLIGGAFGLPDALIQRSSYQLSLSKMTFQHDIALLVLLEQIYRGLTIIHHHPYHK